MLHALVPDSRFQIRSLSSARTDELLVKEEAHKWMGGEPTYIRMHNTLVISTHVIFRPTISGMYGAIIAMPKGSSAQI